MALANPINRLAEILLKTAKTIITLYKFSVAKWVVKTINPSKSLSKFIVLKFHKNQREIIIYEVKKTCISISPADTIEHTWWRLFQKCIFSTKFNIYVFILYFSAYPIVFYCHFWTDATSGAGTADPSGVPEFSPGF